MSTQVVSLGIHLILLTEFEQSLRYSTLFSESIDFFLSVIQTSSSVLLLISAMTRSISAWSSVVTKTLVKH